jgi:hypothetical protein
MKAPAYGVFARLPIRDELFSFPRPRAGIPRETLTERPTGLGSTNGQASIRARVAQDADVGGP